MHKKYLAFLLLPLTLWAEPAQNFLYFPSQDVKAIVKAIALQNDLNIFCPESLSGVATLRTSAKTWQEQLANVLEPMGYSFEVGQTGLVVITPHASASFSILLKYKTPRVIVDNLKKYLLTGESLEAATSSVVVTTTKERIAFLSNLVAQYDVAHRQALVECRFQEVSRSLTKSLGLDWSGVSGAKFTLGEVSKTLGDSPAQTATLTVSQMSLVLQALDADARGKVLSQPSVRAVDGENATVSVGQEYPLPQYNYSTDTGTLQLSGFSYKNIGISLSVSPVFITPDNCQLTIAPEVSSVSDTVVFGGVGAATIPVISSRKVKTLVEVKDGDTVVISGLIDRKENQAGNGVPMLSKIPLFGSIFGKKNTSTTDTELLIFVTVKFI